MKNTKYKTMVYMWLLLIGIVLLVGETLLIHALLRMVREPSYRGEQVYDFHVVLITEDKNRSFWEEVYHGALSLAQKNSVAVELQTVDYARGESVSELIDIAGAAGVDGILTCVANDSGLTEAIDAAVQQGIPVVTVAGDDPDSARQSCVGVDYYALGVAMGNLLLELDSENVVVFMRESVDKWQISNLNLSAGMRVAIQKRPQIETAYMQSGDKPFSIEALVQSVARGTHTTDTILCDNIEDTLTAVNAVIENNMVGKIRIVGYNESNEVLEYIQKGVVYAVITTDGETVGGSAMQSFLDLQSKGWANEFVSNTLEIVRAENVQSYLDRYTIRDWDME